jgi:hypothetical protein
MNERVKELAEQATETIEIFNPDTGITHRREFFDKDKFAELIVREMCDVFDKRAEPGTGFYEPHEPSELIKEHFGVEE